MNMRALKRRPDIWQLGIPLERGMICNNCDMIFDIGELVGSGSCPFCVSESVANLSRWIKRPDLKPVVIDAAHLKTGRTR